MVVSLVTLNSCRQGHSTDLFIHLRIVFSFLTLSALYYTGPIECWLDIWCAYYVEPDFLALLNAFHPEFFY